MSDLMAVERARELLAGAHSVDAVKEVHDKAVALTHYLRQRGASVESINYCAEIKIRAERRTGELTARLPKAQRGGRPDRGKSPSTGPLPKVEVLAQAGLSKQRASAYEKIARIEPRTFESALARAKAIATENDEPLTTAAIVAAATQTSGADGYDGDEWYTPPDVIALVRDVLGEIDLDPASNPHAQKTVKAALFCTKVDNALGREWNGRVFCNPPYSMPLIAEFTAKLIAEYDSGRVTAAIYLVNNCTDSAWFHSLLVRFPVCFTRGRIGFMNQAGQKFATRQGQAIFYLGKSKAAFKQAFSTLGAVVSA